MLTTADKCQKLRTTWNWTLNTITPLALTPSHLMRLSLTKLSSQVNSPIIHRCTFLAFSPIFSLYCKYLIDDLVIRHRGRLLKEQIQKQVKLNITVMLCFVKRTMAACSKRICFGDDEASTDGFNYMNSG